MHLEHSDSCAIHVIHVLPALQMSSTAVLLLFRNAQLEGQRLRRWKRPMHMHSSSWTELNSIKHFCVASRSCVWDLCAWNTIPWSRADMHTDGWDQKHSAYHLSSCSSDADHICGKWQVQVSMNGKNSRNLFLHIFLSAWACKRHYIVQVTILSSIQRVLRDARQAHRHQFQFFLYINLQQCPLP